MIKKTERSKPMLQEAVDGCLSRVPGCEGAAAEVRFLEHGETGCNWTTTLVMDRSGRWVAGADDRALDAIEALREQFDMKVN